MGMGAEAELTETGSKGSGFLADLCEDWEGRISRNGGHGNPPGDSPHGHSHHPQGEAPWQNCCRCTKPGLGDGRVGERSIGAGSPWTTCCGYFTSHC